jgi:hypothetical protein
VLVGTGRWLASLASAVLATPVLAMAPGSGSGAPPTGRGNTEPSSGLEVNVMNEPMRGGEPELAIDPLNPQDLVMGHTVVGNTYTNPGNELAAPPRRITSVSLCNTITGTRTSCRIRSPLAAIERRVASTPSPRDEGVNTPSTDTPTPGPRARRSH